ncbi:MAG TPA: alkaline phosphatase family protein, partial [Vicinamibacteria bacterium]|nr:alkaline phosphatase family protein [Vicinamibacteria bacterium]
MSKLLATFAVLLAALVLFFDRRAAPTEAASYRVMILGFDGMDPEFLESMLSQGKLPNFQKLMREGAYAPCRSFKPT